jgi:NAD(P)-dependent dehydrogenase (short-subunit alcohol dehydrogenase family)
MQTFNPPCRAVVVGASGGIGGALAARIAADGIPVHALARRQLSAGRNIAPGRIDLEDPAGIAAACAAIAEGAPLRLAIVATGLLHDETLRPEKSLKTIDAGALARAFAVNTIGPALVAKHLLPVMPREGKAVFAVLSARVGSITDNRIGGWYGYRASKAALNQILRTLAIEVRRTRPETIVVALHPGTVATPLSAPYRGGVESERLFAPEAAAAKLLDVIEALRPEDSGGFFAWDGSPIPF